MRVPRLVWRKVPRLVWRCTWTVWVIGLGVDLDTREGGICLGPFALWVRW
jgi:hypothetical protein